jgi:hypothetical protein
VSFTDAGIRCQLLHNGASPAAGAAGAIAAAGAVAAAAAVAPVAASDAPATGQRMHQLAWIVAARDDDPMLSAYGHLGASVWHG